MAANLTRIIGSEIWELVTLETVTEIAFQCISGVVLITVTNGTDAPDENAAYYQFLQGEGDTQFNLANAFPGINNPNRVWMRGVNFTPKVSISHA